MKLIRIIFILTMSFIFVYATNYTCTIDTIKYLESDQIKIIPKDQRNPLKISVTSNYASINISNNIYKLKNEGTQQLITGKKVDIYKDESMQLEIIDISSSWSVGARLFVADRMYLIGNCKH